MKDEIKEIYLSNLEWTKTHDNIGGVMGNVVFKDNMSYETYQKLLKSGYFVLCDKDYITNLQEENKRLEEEKQNINNRNCNQRIANKKLMEDIERLRTNLKTHKRRRKKQTHKKNIYKSRNEKAIEYIKNDLILTDGFMIYEDGAKELLNILQGEDYNKVERAYLDDEWIGEDKQ